jgi:hypothetical protein
MRGFCKSALGFDRRKFFVEAQMKIVKKKRFIIVRNLIFFIF